MSRGYNDKNDKGVFALNSMSTIKKICITAICVALCVVLPMAFHAIGLGSTFCPMHIPVLLCGLVCGGVYGLVCGAMGPVLSSIITAMPGPAMLPSMVPELMVYGLVTGLMMGVVRTKKVTADLYICLVTAMLLGRVVAGIAKALLLMNGEGFTLAMWISSHFVTSAPGIACHLVLVPILVLALMKARLIPKRY